MCGIAGGISVSPGSQPDPSAVQIMIDHLAHRGPDGQGLWTSRCGRVCLGHRRLSVIDLAGGGQPMATADGHGAITFNGEIYNYVEIAEQLRRSGVQLRATSDTAVLLALGMARGSEALLDVRGMFAFALWDGRSGRLLIARDRIGKKPLFYTVHEGVLYFASSLDALRRGTSLAPTVAREAIKLYLSLGYIPAPWTAYAGVAKLPAAHLLEVEAGRSAGTPRRYWTPAASNELTTDFEAAVDRVDQALQEAVSIRLRSDVPLGVLLSGGVDSSLVAAVVARKSASPPMTFSIGFHEREYDELPHARRVAQALKTDHREFMAEPELFALLPEFLRHFGEPFADSSALNMWLLARHTRQHVTVALSGDGGDEVFGGYDWYLSAMKLARASEWLPPIMASAGRGLLAPLESLHLPWAAKARRGLAFLETDDAALRFARQRCLLSDSMARKLFGSRLRAASDEVDAEQLLIGIYRQAGGDALRKMRVVDLDTYLADCLMPKVDVASMRYALEVRSPLLDQQVVEIGLGLPQQFLADDRTGKLLLRKVAERYLPRELLDRPKQGFSMPLAVWFRRELRETVRQLASGSALLDEGWIDQGGLQELLDEHQQGSRDHGDRLFSLLALNMWLSSR